MTVSNEDDHQWKTTLKWKTTSNGRLPQISKVKHLNIYWSDLPKKINLGLCDQTKLLECFKWRWLPMEDDPNGRLPQMSKVKYLNNYWSDLPQLLNLGLCDQTKLYEYFIWKWPPMEDDLKWKTNSNRRLPQISKVKYLRNYWSDPPQILNLGLCTQTKLFECFKWRWPPMEDDLK